ncbi:MAG: hypothetical protein HC831_04510 [Chloroflexia bacterium]|nr:hypothetical protein [Chloroflexia bacterium]
MFYIINNGKYLAKQSIRNWFVVLVLFSLGVTVTAQIRNGNVNREVDMKFLFPKMETTANKSVFNILTIKNNSNFKFTGKLNLIQPEGWNIVGDNEIILNIEASDSILIPLRIIASKSVLGEVAYAIVASLSDRNEVSILSEYCFVNIPRISGLNIESPSQVIYFDNKTGIAKFHFRIKNKGNINELVQLNFETNENLAIEGRELDSPYSYEYNIPAYTDTIVEINVNLTNKDVTSNDFFKLDLNTQTQDTIYKNSLWFNKLNNSYSHTIPQENKCAIIELTASDILSTRKPRYSLLAKGSLLLKNNIDLYYYYRNSNLEEDISYYYNDRGYIGVKNDYFKIQAGTVQNIFNEYVFGLGGISEFKLKKNSIGGHYSNNDKTLQTFYGGNASISPFDNAKFSFGYSENNLELDAINSKILYSGAELSFFKKSRISLRTYLNSTTHNLITSYEKQGFAILGNYSANYRKIKINARVEYGSPEYSGLSRGKNLINANFLYSLNNGDFINFCIQSMIL